ncbi:hypothetical protein GGTG_07687 [Gaeumannomyces tritici R3-111a-1]|uniref:Uncharacterized protein n=1 Tax=Gaeumannomyces tritici (strain R3-111a-1) TaxID=644352 RepID=J3P2E0_GAET3|nr:hypothetical protein GGTG_07687 [Gaeumannomyces tritici R3-111a-1]EJT73832.1 hypothetical protein GGTG_07687 [Gaeumannomyces tritici R3-111a-1]
MASPFALELVRASPDAKVVPMQHVPDRWWASSDAALLEPTFAEPAATLLHLLAAHVLGRPVMRCLQKLHSGFYAEPSRRPTEARARAVALRYFNDVRRLAPPGRLLEYELGSGREPLCRFLGRDAPDKPFPFANEGVA